jgi:hypothetical protein
MTFRVVWISQENWWPEHRDFNTHHEADEFAANTTNATIHQLGDPCPTKTTPANSAENKPVDAPPSEPS